MSTQESSLENKIKEVLSQYACYNCGTPLHISEHTPLSTFSREMYRQDSNTSCVGNEESADKLTMQAPGYPFRAFKSNEDQLHIEMIRPGGMAGDTGNESYRTSIDRNGIGNIDEGSNQYYSPRSAYTPSTPSTGILIPLGNGETVISHGDGIKKFRTNIENNRWLNEIKPPGSPSKARSKILLKSATPSGFQTARTPSTVIVQVREKDKKAPQTVRSLSSQKPRRIKEVSKMNISLKDLTKIEPKSSFRSSPQPSSNNLSVKAKVQQINLVEEIRKKKETEGQSKGSSYSGKISQLMIQNSRVRNPIYLQAKIVKTDSQINIWSEKNSLCSTPVEQIKQ
ncbi:unnamed protein product [Blepharisma stoltei]|uniref:Uncharacterized protein n=1 Tax=Blepharisma stoltei TaxID=1481888 RepID=A0AAU9IZL0_9CILI|nr:unnamed protein product [Blepharisma stoltei]